MATLLGLPLALAACENVGEQRDEAKKLATLVDVMRPLTATGSAQINGIGTVTYDQEVILSFPVSGIVEAIAVDDGSYVAAGSVIARIQADTAGADLRAAQLDALRAAQARRRLQALANKGFATRAQLEAAQAADGAAGARIEQARFVARNTVLRAPRGGLVLARLAEVGQVVQAGTPVVRLGVATSGLVARLAFPADSRIEAGSPVTLTLGQGSAQITRTVSVKRVLPQRNTATGTIDVEVPIPASFNMAPGNIVRAAAALPGGRAATLVPLSAVVDGRTDQATLFVVDSHNRVQRKSVTIDGLRGDAIVVTAGLAANERIVVRGVPYVRPGQQVRIGQELAASWSN